MHLYRGFSVFNDGRSSVDAAGKTIPIEQMYRHVDLSSIMSN